MASLGWTASVNLLGKWNLGPNIDSFLTWLVSSISTPHDLMKVVDVYAIKVHEAKMID
ncbi:unnamed protein product [Dovyalis caffra]|uniref:Uncharacterized protein n=1 Tax=Dovyalis caffra TaxID=77055 RepID=A0AAV1SIM4_9ROSI|nr:unnamed protein product [Dovyalis caffra]